MFFVQNLFAQGNRLSIQILGPSKLSICGVNDTSYFEVYNISSGTVTSIVLKLNLPPGIKYVRNTVLGGGVSESNISNLNQPEFTAPNLLIAKNFKFKLLLSADCDLMGYLSSSIPLIQARANYTGNYDIGSSIPFQVRVPSGQIVSILNLSYTGDIGTKFTRTINIGNYGKGPLREIKLKRINGKDIQTYFVNKGANSFSGDTVVSTFGTAFFKTIGNLDTFLDQNETFVVIDSNVIKGCKQLNTAYELTWGCNKKFCQTTKTSGSASISNKSPVLKAIPYPVTPTCYNKNIFKSEIRFVNTGNMLAVSPRVSISLNYPYVMSTFDTSSIRIKVGYKGTYSKVSKDSTTATYNLGYYGCIGLYPIGFFRIKSPDLKPNDTLFVTWSTETCTAPVCSNASMLVNCWAYYADYKDQCKNLKNVPWAWGKVYDQHYMTSSSFIPTDLVNGQKGEFRTLISSASLFPTSSSARYYVELVLPKGLVHSKLKKDLYFINSDLTANWNPDSIVQIGDTLRGYFPHPIPISLANAELVFYLTADCSKTGANGNQTIKLQIRYNPDKNCNPKEWLYLTCQTMAVKIHCVSNCAGGLKFRNFSVQRINFGKPDNNNDGKPDNTGKIDTLKVREERCFVGDTIMAVYTGTVKRTSSIISWRYNYIESDITGGKFLDIVGIQLLVWRRGITLSTNCTQIRRYKTISGNNATFKIHLSTDSLLSCVSSSYRYNSDDSIIVKVKYKVTSNIGGATMNIAFTNRFYTSNIVNPTSNANKFQCDTFSGQMIMAGYYFTTCCADNYQLNSCAQVAVNNYYYMGIGACCSNYGGNNYFPYEYRNFARLKEVRFYMPSGFTMKKSIFAQYRTAGSNKTAYELKDTIRPVNVNAYPISYDVRKYFVDSAKGMVNYSDDAFHGYFQAFIEPSCSIQSQGKIPIKYDFIFERLNTLGSGYDTVSSGNTDNIIYNKPVTTIKSVFPTIYASQDTAEWELEYTNYSATFSNTNAWFAPDNSGAVKVVQIKDATSDTLMPSKNLIFKLGTIPFNKSRKFKVRAIYNSCNKDSVILYSGWNCQTYPNDLASFNCLKDRIALYIEPQNTQFQSTITDSSNVVDLCSNTPYTLTIENAGLTKGYNPRAYINLPIGMSVVPGSCYLKYPHKGSKTSIPLPTVKSGTTYEWNLGALNTALSFGLKGVNDTNKNKIIVYFKVKTDCNYSSGNYIRAGGSGNIKCGDPVLSYSCISNPLNIKGVTRPYYTLLKTESDSIFPCEKSSKLKVKIINLGPAKTGSEDKYQVVLLPGMTFDSSSFNSINNGPNNTLTKSRNINGATELEFSLPSNVDPGDSMAFEFKYTADGRKLNCGNIDLYSQAAVKQEVLCVSDNSKCKINVVTGNSLLKVPVFKGGIVFFGLKSKLLSTSSDSESLDLSYSIRNVGNKIVSSNPIVLKYVYDRNNSGTADAKDLVAFIDTQYINLSKNGTANISKNIKVKAGISCALFVMLDSASCSCNFSYSKFPIPPLKNAGFSKSVCSGDTIKIGIAKVSGYRYLWTPGSELSNDTISNPFAVISNNDTGKIKKQFILTTYRGQCNSKDTALLEIYKLPEISILQNDTTVCSGQKVVLRTAIKSANGGLKISWTPNYKITDTTSYNPTVQAQKDTKYKASIVDSKNCQAKDSIFISTKEYPRANFGFSKTCEGNMLSITDSSKIFNDSINYIRWTENTLDTLNISSFNFDLLGNLSTSFKLTVKSTFGCTDTIRKTVFVNPLPKANFSSFNACYGDSILFKDLSSVISGTIKGYKFETGDGSQYFNSVFKHRFANADTFKVSLFIESDRGCNDTFVDDVIVYPRPKANFNVSNICSGDSLKPVNLSSVINDSIVNYQWLILNDTFTNTTPIFYYKQDTLYTIELKVNSSMGCRDSISKLAEVFKNPMANLSVLPVCEGKSSSVFSTSVLSKGSIISYNYSQSDGGVYNSPNYIHSFATGDTFDIRLIVNSNNNCKDTIVKQAIVFPRIVPNFTLTDTCLNDMVIVKDKSQFINTGIRNWIYDFGNGDSVFIANPFYKYSRSGIYTVKQILTSNEGCVYDTLGLIKIHPQPSADFKDTNKCVDNQFKFFSKSNIITGTIQTYKWLFSDNTSSVLKDPNHVFPSSGNYKIKHIVYSTFGCVDSIEKTAVSYPPVIVQFAGQNVCLGDPIEFVDKSIVPSSSIKKYLWQFGDNDTSMLKQPKHTYLLSDTFNVKLRITTGYNCDYDTSDRVVVYPVPTASFKTDPDQGTIVNPEIQITDMSIGSDTLIYDLGDGKTSMMRNLANSYPDSGVFTLRQTVWNIYGCRDTFIKTITIRYLYVFNAPTAFSPNSDGINDFYAPGGIGIKYYEMNIFNRWGEMVYRTDNSTPWDGKYMGNDVMEGMYAVTFKVRDFKGRWHFLKTSFLLLR
jgi:gliding motility-associated-like protein